ncbi:MAG: vitamin K epoxide reductase family protein, partial [Vicinamibacterales bacterium]
MARRGTETAALPRVRVAGLASFATFGLLASASSTWVHYQLLRNPGYSSFCDVNATLSCSEAYT